jgi:hypothetical protein
VIATPTAMLAERAIGAMREAAMAPTGAVARPSATQIVLPFEIYGPENI